MQFTIQDDYLTFAEYEFPAAIIYPAGRLHCSQVSEIAFLTGAPSVVCEPFQLLQVPYGQRQDLAAWADQYNVACHRWIDVWGNLLEPFLDTEYTNDWAQKVEGQLQQVGIDQQMTKALRSEFSAMMKAYNFDSMLWDWTYLGLYDLLSAACGILSGPRFKMNGDEFHSFYFRAMKIAQLGQSQERAADFA